MSKKSNSILFILGATAFNILVTLLCIGLLLAVYGYLIMPLLPAESAAWGIPVVFILSIVLSFIIYRAVIKIFTKKVDVEKNFDPLFGRKQPPKKDKE